MGQAIPPETAFLRGYPLREKVDRSLDRAAGARALAEKRRPVWEGAKNPSEDLD